MEKDLIDAGVITDELDVTQYIDLEEVSLGDAPDYIKAAYQLVAGEGDAHSEEETEEEESFV